MKPREAAPPAKPKAKAPAPANRAQRRAAAKAKGPKAKGPKAKAPEPAPAEGEAPPPPEVIVRLGPRQDGELEVVGVAGTGGLALRELQWWLEEGIKFVRRETDRP